MTLTAIRAGSCDPCHTTLYFFFFDFFLVFDFLEAFAADFLADFFLVPPNAAAQLSEYFLVVPLRKIVI